MIFNCLMSFLLVLLQVFAVHGSSFSQMVQQNKFDRFKDLFSARFLGNQEQRYHQVVRARELYVKQDTRLIPPEEVEEYKAWQEEAHQELLEVYDQVGIDPESISDAQYRDLMRLISDLGNVIIVNYHRNHSISINFDELKSLIAESYSANEESQYHQIMHLRDLMAKNAAGQITEEESNELQNLALGYHQEMLGFLMQAGINPGSLIEDQAHELALFFDQISNQIVLSYEQATPLEEDYMQAHSEESNYYNLVQE